MSIEKLKERLADIKAKALHASGQNWRDYRANQMRAVDYIFNPPFAGHGETNLRWIEDVDKAGLRLKGYVKESRHANGDYFASKPSLGWYTDNFQSECLYPVVYQLPARNHKPRFVYGYADPNNEGGALLSFDPCDDEMDAQRWACSLTKSSAEDAREDDAKFQAEQQIEECRETIAAIRHDFLAIAKEIRGNCGTIGAMAAISSALRARLEEMVAERTAAFKRIALLTDEPWHAVE